MKSMGVKRYMYFSQPHTSNYHGGRSIDPMQNLSPANLALRTEQSNTANRSVAGPGI